METRKPPTDNEVQSWLQQGKLALPPLRFALRKVQPQYATSRFWDFEIEARWNNQAAVFAVEYKSLFTPKAFDAALNQCRAAVLPRNRSPLLMLPYLRPTQLEELEQNGISGVDWCGNGVVFAGDKFRVFRTGGRNRFATYSPIKNIYRKNTSMVARVFLLTPKFASVGDVLAEVNRRDVLADVTGRTPVTMGTVSKALKQLEDDLIIERGERVQILQADKLFEQLQQNYETRLGKPVRLKVDCAFEQLPQLLSAKAARVTGPLVATGLSSLSRYATMQREEVLSVYCTDAKRVESLVNGRETDRFPNLELIETNEQSVYFDARQDRGFYWASPIQAWLELMDGDKRDRETATQVKEYIVSRINGR